MNELDLKHLKKVEMEVMDYYVDICKKNNLTYYLFYGSLLGCIRHKGFIPWDDDIDVVMPPNDYLKFLEIMKNESSNTYYLQNISNTKYCPFFFSKIRKYHTTMVEKDYINMPIKKGINIDVFPLLKYPINKWDKFLFLYRFQLISLLVNRDVRKKGFKNKFIYLFLHIIPRTMINKMVIKRLSKLLNYDKEFNEYRVLYPQLFNKEWFEKEEKPFEDKKYCVPKKYDLILNKLYGDYMTPPPKEKRFGHGEGNIILSFDKEYDEI